MFGFYDVPLKQENENFSMSIEKEGDCLLYRRDCLGEIVETLILKGNCRILISPIEPLVKPEEITPFLLIEFKRSVMIEPKETKKIFVKFPIEIGVFISGNKHYDILDILSFVKPKFTLYGDSRHGMICKYWHSEIHTSIPQADPLFEGVLELNITNTTVKWVDVTKVVLNAYGMKIYYGKDKVSMRSTMKIISENLAETDFIDAPIKTGMEKSLEHYAVRKMTVITTKFVMELGI